MSQPFEPDLKALVEHLPYFVVVVDAEARFMWINHLDPTLKLDDVIGQPIEAFTADEWKASSRAVVERCLATGESGYYEVCGYSKGGYEQWYGCRVVALPPDATGRPCAMILSSDINERRHAQAALAQSEERFRCLVEATPEFISIVDSERKVLYLNHEPPSHSGLRRDDVLGKPIESFAAPAARERVTAAIQEVFTTGQPRAYESFDATLQHYYQVNVLPYRAAHDASARAMLLARDVTHEREAARQREAMLAELDHRVKNNMTMVLSMAEQALSRATSLEHFRETFTGRLHSLARTHEALASARWQALPLRDVVKLALNAIGEGRIQLSVDSPNPLLPAHVVAPLSLALHELATNALKHGPLKAGTKAPAKDPRANGGDAGPASSAGGSIELWSTLSDEGVLTLYWKEHGPQPSETRAGGLGLRLVQGLIVHQLGGAFDVQVASASRLYTIVIRLTEKP